MVRVACILLLLASTQGAVNVSGTWTGTMEQRTPSGQVGRMSLRVEIRQEGDRISGTAGPDGSNQAPIQNSKLESSHLTFSVTLSPPPGSDHGPTWKFNLTVSVNGLQGTAAGTMGERSLGETQVALTRRK